MDPLTDEDGTMRRTWHHLNRARSVNRTVGLMLTDPEKAERAVTDLEGAFTAMLIRQADDGEFLWVECDEPQGRRLAEWGFNGAHDAYVVGTWVYLRRHRDGQWKRGVRE